MRAETQPYRREIRWSEEDQCYIGRCPDLFLGGCHGEDPESVEAELGQIIEEAIADYRKAGKPLPEPSLRSARMTSAVAARRRTGLNQKGFARAIGVGVGTLRNWEQGRITPKGTASTLLRIIEKHPEVLREIL
ncbi:MAG: type II toxin-antitoxin system MqsA family antitoxin [Puniceicoccaceae bacterium]